MRSDDHEKHREDDSTTNVAVPLLREFIVLSKQEGVQVDDRLGHPLKVDELDHDASVDERHEVHIDRTSVDLFRL